MKMFRRAIALMLLLMPPLLAGCGSGARAEAEKPVVIATIFPQYDFARRIAGGRIELSMLLSPGAEAHSYEPTPKDMLLIERADLLIATGREMEPWAFRLFEGAGNVNILNASEGIELYEAEDEDGHEDHDGHGLDPHIWTDPRLAIQMARNIKDGLSKIDPDGDAVYQENLDGFILELEALDAAFMEVRESGVRDTMAFASRFAHGYFVRRYDINYISAYASCAEGADPSVRAMKEMIDRILQMGLSVIYYDPLNDTKVAAAIAEETGAKMVAFYSAHTVTPEQFDAGVTYLDLMRENLQSFREGMN